MDYVINKLEEMDKRLSAIDEELTSVTDFSVAKKLNQERALLDEPVTLYRQLKKADAEIADAQLILKDSDEEMREFAKGEIARLSALKEELNKKIELALLPKDINDEKNDLFISIHMNKYQSESVKGFHVFYKDGTSKLLASYIQENANVALEQDKMITKGNFFILNESRIQGVLIECGFLSNANERGQLKSRAYHQKLAIVISDGIEDYFHSLAAPL